MADYKLAELEQAIESSVSRENEVVFISGNIPSLGQSDTADKKKLLGTIYDTVVKCSNGNTTIMVPSLTFNLCNTDIPFRRDAYTSMGVFSNYIVQMPESVRSMHPFASYTAIGKQAEFICKTDSPFPYGIDSPYDNMLTLKNPIMLSIGMKPNLTCSMIHHVEFNMHVPYRYIKEFYHPVESKNGKIEYQNYYLHVLYRDMGGKRNLNMKIFDSFEKEGNKIKKLNVGKGEVYSYNMKDFYESCVRLFKKDIYIWMDKQPQSKPYRR